MNDPALRGIKPALESPGESYAGRTRYTQLEYEALLANASIGIAFTRERRVFLCNPRFAEMFGWSADELIGQPGEVMYPSRESYEALGQIAVPILSAGRQLDLEWELRRKDGSTFLCRMIAKALDAGDTQRGTVWIVEDVTEQRRAEDELQRVLAEQQALLDNVVVGIAFTRDRRYVRCNRRFEELFGFAPGAAVGGSASDLFFTDEQLNQGRTHSREQWLRRQDGSGFWCRIAGRAVKAGDPAKGHVWLFEDVTQAREAEERVQRAAAEQELILDNASVGIAFVRNRAIQRCNRFLEDMVGAGPGELVGESSAVLFASEEAWRGAGLLAYSTTAPGETHDSEWKFKRRDGSVFHCRTRGRRIDAGGEEQEWIWSFEDVTAEREAEARVQQALDALERKVAERTAELEDAKARAQHLAGHDALTGLPNRRVLEDRLSQALALSYRNRQQTAVMFIDLDRFKTINDSLGHSVGDALLKEVAQRLVKQLRVGDSICRIGGDEFVVVLPEVKRSSDVASVAQKVIDQLSNPVLIEERELVVTPSIGISVFPDDGRDAETLIRNADAAMYHAKEMGRANYQFFTEQMNLSASRRLALESDLRRALGRDQLRVHYQPIVEAKSGQVVAHEALVRWQNPHRGLVGPAEFIQVAEETGLILKIGEWVLREACRWATFIGAERGLQVSVNLSPRQFKDPKLVQLVAKALRDSGLPARLLELEITESTAMQHTDTALSTLSRLKELGVSIAIDDFGTGYSSLAYLKRFPVDKVKIDRAFVADVPGDEDQGAIVAAIVALAHALEIKVIAEGVETAMQREFLSNCGCDFLQGYLTGRPLDADSAAKEYL
ncbi:MAG TPA: EAL domain-containing protein [Burkholderiales bacterium]|nr:EAL domain-containing protein [Burkholderiales bacterium]